MPVKLTVDDKIGKYNENIQKNIRKHCMPIITQLKLYKFEPMTDKCVTWFSQ